jgi:Contractile injection system tube protein
MNFSNAKSKFATAELSTASLVPVDSPGKPTINFLFNPAELSFQDKIDTQENPGANNEQTGRPKVSFAAKKASTLAISNVVFDTYEDGRDVIATYIQPFKEATTFIEEMRRPPVYEFMWGNRQYFRKCFVENLSYKLTMFLPDGTPVRAVVDVSLKEADEPKASDATSKGSPNPSQDDRTNPSQGFSLFGAISDFFF